MTDEANQQTQSSPIKLGQATIEEGEPQLAKRASGPTGPRGSRYDDVLDKIPALQQGKGFVRATLEEGTDKDKAIGALRVAIKRRFGKDEAKALKVRALEGNAVGVFRV